MMYPPTVDAHETAILTRAIQSKNHPLSATAARALLRIQLDPQDRERLHELLVRNQEETLKEEERSELNSYLRIGLVVDLLQAKARAVLHGAKRRSARSNG
jgi:hypothetical protein